MSHLDLTYLTAALPEWVVNIFDSLPSTNDFLKKQPSALQLCMAEQQTAGHGRLGKKWFSPKNVNLYFSLMWPFHQSPTQLNGLSLVVALSLVKILSKLGLHPHLKIKWPNDIYWEHKKLAGILIELTHARDNHNTLIIGVGLNVNMHETPNIDPSRPWVSLSQILNRTLDRNLLLVAIMKQLLPDLQQFSQTGFTTFLPLWLTWDYLYGKTLDFKLADGIIHGIARGVNEQGYLLLQDPLNGLKAYSSGTILPGTIQFVS